MTPRTQALAYRIWAYCNPRGWGLTYTEVAEEMGESVQRIACVVHIGGWSDRFKRTGGSGVDNNSTALRYLPSPAFAAPIRTLDTPRRYLEEER